MERELIQFGESHKVQGMTSLEIAEVTGKNHKDVLRDIRNILGQGVSERNFAPGEYKDKNNQSRPMFNLTAKGCLILASGYDVVLREKIINKLEEYRQKERPDIVLHTEWTQAGRRFLYEELKKEGIIPMLERD